MRIAMITLTPANFEHSHVYLSRIRDMFPKDAVGGTTKALSAPRLLEIDIGLGTPIRTDITGGQKWIFRQRDWVKPFLEAHGLKPRDRLVMERTGSDRYHLYPLRA